VSHCFPQERDLAGNIPGAGRLTKKESRFYHWRSAVARVEFAAIINGLRFMQANSANSYFLLFKVTATSFILPGQISTVL